MARELRAVRSIGSSSSEMGFGRHRIWRPAVRSTIASAEDQRLYEWSGHSAESPNPSWFDAYSGFGSQYGYRWASSPSTLELLGHRFYDTATGRFVNRDPIGYAGGMNLYEYAGNNFYDEIDPSGFYLTANDPVTTALDHWLFGGAISRFAQDLGAQNGGCPKDRNEAADGFDAVTSVALLFLPGGEEAKGAELAEEGAGDAVGGIERGGGAGGGGGPTPPSPNFVVTPGGDAVIVPEGAEGPIPTDNGRGFQFVDGSGGSGLHAATSNVRIMDPTEPRGPSPGYPNGYANYQNGNNQTVNPFSGRTLPPSDPWAHMPFGE